MTAAPRIVVVGGPTAGGKSALALRLAQRLNGEVIGADSRQLYAGTTIAAAGPTDDERALVPHHLYGTVPPTETLSAGRFVTLADRAITDVIARGRTAVVVGGTGLYLRALRVGLDEARPVDPALRNRLKDDLRTQGLAALVERLRALRRGDGGDVHDAEGERNDGDAAAGDLGDLDVKNPMRVLRALELALSNTAVAARDANAFLARPPRPGVQGARWLLVSRSPGVLANRIAARTRAMFATGTIVDEARALAAVLPADHPLLATIGIAEALAVARGTLETGGAIAQTATRTRQYARRQRTWFRKEPWWTPLADDAGDAGDEDVLAAAVAALDREDSACAGDACTGNASMLEGCAVNGRGGQR